MIIYTIMIFNSGRPVRWQAGLPASLSGLSTARTLLLLSMRWLPCPALTKRRRIYAKAASTLTAWTIILRMQARTFSACANAQSLLNGRTRKIENAACISDLAILPRLAFEASHVSSARLTFSPNLSLWKHTIRLNPVCFNANR